MYQTTQQLYNQLQSPSNLILVDCRYNKGYTSQSIRTSINIDWSNLTNENRGLLSSADILQLSQTKAKRFALRKHFNVFLYDSCDYTECPEEDRNKAPAWRLLEAIREEGQAREPVYML